MPLIPSRKPAARLAKASSSAWALASLKINLPSATPQPPHPASNPRTGRRETLPLLPFGLRHITINSHQRIRVSLKVSSKSPQRIRPPGHHITQSLRRGTSYERRMLGYNIRQQRQAILGLFTSPHNNSSRTLLSPKLQLHMGTHVAPLSHASDPRNHRSAAPTVTDRAGHAYPHHNRSPDTGWPFPHSTGAALPSGRPR